ncbi:hypothetical protein, unlikely [Trypanosoma brucei gambiense DAL972]|uniref:Uncharacterized protein n=1 Tax=Trypanosoma brucei gambiense (strain MHOM/CI/86/DAL972) TaxID=679716 RepID=D0A8D1_TRYB9|nr:hypothetical protein, unlikely [Trypanosoma brucei gambiense DAL972]CBH17932.1 hypothetical protein, unlikely [Trypanosoma brucei gambiense DAL972]|eukprot:XP_011780196.1 hypothetical protein, unlikely [Trypanosoma brucei gambiense DAL972]
MLQLMYSILLSSALLGGFVESCLYFFFLAEHFPPVHASELPCSLFSSFYFLERLRPAIGAARTALCRFPYVPRFTATSVSPHPYTKSGKTSAETFCRSVHSLFSRTVLLVHCASARHRTYWKNTGHSTPILPHNLSRRTAN